jgi:hypothetical protein
MHNHGLSAATNVRQQTNLGFNKLIILQLLNWKSGSTVSFNFLKHWGELNLYFFAND